MFEKPLYEFEPVATPQQEGDLFKDYEIKSWIFTPRIIRIVTLSAVVNIVAILVVAQTSLLTMKGCDSPLVGSVCQVLDTVYVGAMLFGTDREMVDVAYEKTELGEDDEITYIDVSNIEPPLKYPNDYFQIANPEKFIVPEEIIDDLGGVTQGIPGIPNGLPYYESPNTGNLFDTPQKLPTPNPNVLEGDLNGGGGNYYMPTPKPYKPYKPGRKPKIAPTPEETTPEVPDENAVAQVDSSPSASPTPVPSVDPLGPLETDAINTRPFKDLAKDVIALLEQKQIDLQAPVQVVARAKLGKDGKVVKDSFAVTSATGNDKQLAMVIAKSVAAFNDSNLLTHLKALSGKDLTFLVEQDQANVVAGVKSQVETDTRAQSIAATLQFVIKLAVQNKQDGLDALVAENNPEKAQALQNLKDDLALLQNTKVTTNGKEFIVNFAAPKGVIHEMIQRKLIEQKAAQPKPTDSSATTKPAEKPGQN